MKHTNVKSSRSGTSANPTTLNLQTRPFAPIQADSDQDDKVTDGVSVQARLASSENLLAKLIATPKPEPSATPIRRKAFPSMRMPIQAKLNIGEPNDKYEKEADNTAAMVVQQINSSPQDSSVQRESMEEEDELQMKPAISTIQREESMEEEDELQMKSLVQRRENLGGGEASADLESSIQSARGSGQSLDPSLQAKMGQAMGADFSGVKVHTDSQSDQLNKSIQAKAFTTGQDVFFRQGAYEPSSRGGQELIAHELTHVVQQNISAVQRRASFPVQKAPSTIQRFTVVSPYESTSSEKQVNTSVNELIVDNKTGKFNYKAEAKKNVGLRVSDDNQMAVPNISQTKDFYSNPKLLKDSQKIMEAQTSVAKLVPTGKTLSVFGELLIGIKPIASNGQQNSGDSGAVNNAAVFVDTCIEMAHLITSGKQSSTNFTPVTNQGASKEGIQSKDPIGRAEQLKSQFSKSKAKELGINQFASPEVGEMLTTLNLLDRLGKEDFEYHFAGVVAKSGADFVTLENFNRSGEGNKAMQQNWALIMDVKTNAELYKKELDTLKEYYLDEMGEEYLLENQQKISAQAEEKFIHKLNELSDKSEPFTNTVDQNVKGALWYFQMYGPASKQVEVEAVAKGENGERKTEKGLIDQSFHGHMGATDDFGEMLTLRVSTTNMHNDQTSGTDPRVANIVEPPQALSLGDKMKGNLYHRSKQGKAAEQLKEEARQLASNPSDINESNLNKLEKRLVNITDSRTVAKVKYIIQTLRLLPAVNKKNSELEGRIQEFGQISPDQLQELAGISGQYQEKIKHLVESGILEKLSPEVNLYEKTFQEVLSHEEFQKSIPNGTAAKIQTAVQRMRINLNEFESIFKMVRNSLSSPEIVNGLMEELKKIDPSSDIYLIKSRRILEVLNQRKDLIKQVDRSKLMDLVENAQFNHGIELDGLITGVYKSPQYSEWMYEESTTQGENVLGKLNELKKVKEQGSQGLPSFDFDTFLQTLQVEEQLLRSAIDLINQGDVEPQKKERLNSIIAQSQFRTVMLLKIFEQSNANAEEQLKNATAEDGVLSFYGGSLGNVGAYIGNVRKFEKKRSTENRRRANYRQIEISKFMEESAKVSKSYATLLFHAKVGGTESMFNELIKASQA